MPDCAKCHQNQSNGLWESCFLFFKMAAAAILDSKISIYWLMGSGHRDTSPIQISPKSVNALWRYSDFTIFQYDYNWPFGPQNYGPHFTHTSAHFGPRFTRWRSACPPFWSVSGIDQVWRKIIFNCSSTHPRVWQMFILLLGEKLSPTTKLLNIRNLQCSYNKKTDCQYVLHSFTQLRVCENVNIYFLKVCLNHSENKRLPVISNSNVL